jgi:hypothetical protein
MIEISEVEGFDLDKLIQKNKYREEINEAIEQEDKLFFFLQTQVTNNLFTSRYTNYILSTAYYMNNPFMNWVRSWMREDNFLTFSKFFRFPLPTNALLQDDIIPQLEKVFDSQNKVFQYHFESEDAEIDALNYMSLLGYDNYFESEAWEARLERHNSVLVTDLSQTKENEPYRYLVDIRQVVAIDFYSADVVKWILFKDKDFYYWYTDRFYSVWKKEETKGFTFIFATPHELGVAPAIFISPQLNINKKVVRKHIFSNFLTKFETYVSLKVIFELFNTNVGLPSISMYSLKKRPCGSKFQGGAWCVDGHLTTKYGFQRGVNNTVLRCPICNPKTPVQIGTVFKIPKPTPSKEGGAIIDLQDNFIKFHYPPPEVLEFEEDHINRLENDIRFQLVGSDKETTNEDSKNRDQIKKGLRTLENTLKGISKTISKTKKRADDILFKLRYGEDYKGSFIDYGTDFYLESVDELTKQLEDAKKSGNRILISELNRSIDETTYRNDQNKRERGNIIRQLEIFSNDSPAEVDERKSKELISDEDYQYYIKFDDLIKRFELERGDLVTFMKTGFFEGVALANKINTIKGELLLLLNGNKENGKD